jgi:ankyrin repeat protein
MASEKENKVDLSELQRSIFDKIGKNETNDLKNILAQFKENVDFVDENGMTPLQHAAYKGNKEAVQLLLDRVRIDQSTDRRAFYSFPTISGSRRQFRQARAQLHRLTLRCAFR